MAEPKCKYFGKCNGCTAQHIDYAAQLENKKKALARASGINAADIRMFSGSEYNYRSRMDFFFHKSGLGLRDKDNPSSIIDVEECAIASKRINKLLLELRSFFKNADAFDLNKRTGAFRQAIIRAPETTKNSSAICFILNQGDQGIEDAAEKIKEFAKATIADNVLVLYVDSESEDNFSEEFSVVKGSDTISEKYFGKTFWFSAQGFFQNNHNVAEKMHNYCNELMQKYGKSGMTNTKDSHLLDLYAGVGTFGIINSGLFKSVTIVESVKPAIDCANKNICENSIKNAKAIALDAKQIRRIEFQQPLFVITDPPRSGMDEKTIETLKSLKPEFIIYISCNVQQLAKDIPKFKNYDVKSAALFDLFPQTNHFESVVELIRKHM